MPTKIRGPLYDSTVARNLRLIIQFWSHGSISRFAKMTDMSRATISRVAAGTQDTTISVLTRIATAAGFESWQLLRDDFDPQTAQPLADAEVVQLAQDFSRVADPVDRKRLKVIFNAFVPRHSEATWPRAAYAGTHPLRRSSDLNL